MNIRIRHKQTPSASYPTVISPFKFKFHKNHQKQWMNTPEKSTKSQTQFRWYLKNAMHVNVVHLHLIHYCDGQPQVAVRESALKITSHECHKSLRSILNSSPNQKGKGGKHFRHIENWPSLHSTQHALYALSTLILWWYQP